MKFLNTYLLMLFVMYAKAQSLLSIDEAIKLGLENNYSVLIAKNNSEISKIQNNFGNAGMSPTVTLNGNLNLANVNSYQEFSTGVIQVRDAAQSNTTGASLNVGWTIFDGMRMFSVRKRLSMNEKISDIALKQEMENTIFEIVKIYYEIVRTDELMKASKHNLKISQEKLKIAKLKLEIGSDSKVDVLLLQSEENKSKSELLHLELQLIKAKSNLNSLIKKSADTDFAVTDSIIVNYQPNIDELKKSILTSNQDILLSKQNESIIAQTIHEVKSNYLPSIQLNGAYNFIRSQNQAGFVFLNRQAGLNGGLSARWNLFDGTKNNTLLKERKLLLLNQKYQTEQLIQLIDANVYNSLKAFELNKQILELEKQNLSDSKEVLDVSIERYRIGKTNLLETIETQKNYQDAQVRYINALYNIKLSETELLKANGKLVH
jgi:outer membrane protein